MKERVLATVLAAVHDWKCPGYLYGTGALMVCAAKAIEHEKNGETWTPLGVAQEYANEKGYTQRNVWAAMDYALRQSRGPLGPAVAIKAIVKGAYKNGYIDEV